jgi:hypothetical protein
VAVITDTERDVKMMMLDGHLMARVAISDYKLTMSTPANLTSWVGVDSLTHAIEAYVSKKATVLTDMLALEAARLIGAHMRRVVEHPDDEPAREAMMLGATLAGRRVLELERRARPRHEPPDRRALPPRPRPQQRAAAADRDPLQRHGRARALRARRARDAPRHRRGLRPGRVRSPRRRARGAQRRPEDPVPVEAGVERDHFERVVQDMAQAALDSGSPGFNPEPASKEQIVELYGQAY